MSLLDSFVKSVFFFSGGEDRVGLDKACNSCLPKLILWIVQCPHGRWLDGDLSLGNTYYS